jgi:TolB-like protein
MISPQIEIEKDAPLLVGTVVNVDSMNQSSRFGRTVSELVASRLTQLGYNVIEMKLRSSGVYIREGTGELLLSRDIRDLSSNYNAKIVIVGNYSVASQYVYMTLKAVSVADNRVISAVNYSLPITVDNRALLFPPKQ